MADLLRTAALAVFVSLLAASHASAKPGAAVDDPVEAKPGDVIARVETDFDGDGGADVAALIVGADEEADLQIWLGDRPKPVHDLKSFAWRGILYGQQPTLAIGPQGSLVLGTENTGVGSYKWTTQLTLAHRDGRFVVAGYTFWGVVDLTPEGPVTLECDFNLLTGEGSLNGEPMKLAPRRISLQSWRSGYEDVPECVKQ